MFVMVDSEIVKTRHGFYVLRGDTHISKWSEESGRLDHDQNMLPLVLPHISRGHTVVDIGAFIGDHTVAYANKVGREGKVYAFEPFKKSYECLKLNMANYANVVCLNQALGYKGKTMGFYENENTGATYMGEGEEAVTRPLDGYDFQALDFMKIDAEGMEVDILLGAEKTIKRFMPVMLLEVNEGALKRQGRSVGDLFQLLDNLGYSFNNIYPNQTISHHQCDILCIKK